MGELILQKGKEKLPLNGHPWIYLNAVAAIKGNVAPGDSVTIKSQSGNFVGYAQYAGPQSGITARIFSTDEAQLLDEALFLKRLKEAAALRKNIIPEGDNAYRLCFSEADRLPGLIVDIFDDTAVLQSTTPGIDRYKFFIAESILQIVPHVCTVIEKSDSDGRKMQNAPGVCGHLAGKKRESHMIEIVENALRYAVDLNGQKTGFYADQRLNRRAVASYIRPGMRVLDTCCYTGAFALNMLRAGAAHALLLDSSQQALAAAEKNMTLNGMADGRFECRAGSAFDVMRQLAREGKQFDMIVLDPPKLIRSVHQKDAGFGAYKDLNFAALKLLKNGGMLATFSCSGNLSASELQLVLSFAAKDAQKSVRIVQTLGQGPDHPVLLTCPESAYLKGLICAVN